MTLAPHAYDPGPGNLCQFTYGHGLVCRSADGGPVHAAALSTFEAQLEAKLELYRKKNADYTGGLSTYFNFEHTAALVAPLVREGVDPVDVVFLVMEGIKISRLIALKSSGKVPHHESILDSHADFSNYALIWEAYQRDKAKQ